VTAAKNNPPELADLDPERVRFTIAAIERNTNGDTHYHNYVLSKISGKPYLYTAESRTPALAEVLQPDLDQGGTLKEVRPGIFSYTFKTALPADYDREVTHVVGGEISTKDGKVANPTYEFVPSGDKANASHTDEEKRKAANGPMPPQSVHYKRLIHRIHTGVNLGEPFTVYGGTPTKPGAIEFSDIRFPGDRRNCVKCHVPGANEPPLPAGLLPTLIPQADGTVKALQPIMSACVGCHTSEPAKLHMETMTSNGQESCVTCHGVGRSFAVKKVHQR